MTKLYKIIQKLYKNFIFIFMLSNNLKKNLIFLNDDKKIIQKLYKNYTKIIHKKFKMFDSFKFSCIKTYDDKMLKK